MRRFHFPLPAAVAAVTVVAGLASYQGVDKLVLAKSGAPSATAGGSGHDSSPGNGTGNGDHHASTSTTSTTVHHEPTSSTIPTPPPEPGATTSTTVHHETGSTTPTTIHKETPPPSTSTTVHHEPTTPPVTTAPPTTTVAPLSFGCMNGVTGDQGWAKCEWSQSKSPNFDHYVLTREVPGSSHQVIFETSDVTNTYYVDGPLAVGGQYTYWVGAFDAAGHLIGQGGPIHLTCCPGGTATP
ncbi:MAG: hypothetical protein JOZ68_02795 [Acidimicrobiia bacterium]|nr:hypothetical protein [Acidimicrobiia bacterium]